jgi:MoaA/NifB/PqqE/SkfB family radical SAM enzyme
VNDVASTQVSPVARRAKELLVVEEPVRRLRRLFLWVTSGCNSRCVMCDIWKEKPGQGLDVATIEGWAPEWQRLGIPSVILCGEPMMHGQIWEICRVIRAHGIRVELLSNGYLLKRFAREVADSCDVLRVSLDGPAEIHNETRGIRNAFGKLADGIAALRAVAPGYPVTGRCAIHRMNFRHIIATVAAARELGLDAISFSGTDVHNEEAFKRHDAIDSAYVDRFAIRGAELLELEQELTALGTACAADLASGFIEDTPEELGRNVLGYYRALAGEVPFPSRPCNAPWVSVVVEYGGVVRPCFPLDSYGSLGADRSLESVLNSIKARALRAALDVESNPACQRCVCQTAVYT